MATGVFDVFYRVAFGLQDVAQLAVAVQNSGARGTEFAFV